MHVLVSSDQWLLLALVDAHQRTDDPEVHVLVGLGVVFLDYLLHGRVVFVVAAQDVGD